MLNPDDFLPVQGYYTTKSYTSKLGVAGTSMSDDVSPYVHITLSSNLLVSIAPLNHSDPLSTSFPLHA